MKLYLKKAYIRFGDLPKNNKSKNYLINKLENGVSVYNAVLDGEYYKIVLPELTESACVSLSGVLRRKCFLVEGDLIGLGSDNEPLLKNIKIIKEVNKKVKV
jgi:hypothetical protein